MYNRDNNSMKRVFAALLLCLGALALTAPFWASAAEKALKRLKANPFNVEATRPLRSAQLDPASGSAKHRVEIQMENLMLKGQPPHVITLKLHVALNDPKYGDLVKELEPELESFTAGLVSELTYNELSSLSGKWRLRESLLLFLNEHLPQEACAREIYVTDNRLQ